jgi:hypothetical protein
MSKEAKEKQKPEETLVSVINSQESAEKFYHQNKYSAPSVDSFAYVSSDFNVFWEANHSKAESHAFKNNLQLFKIKVNGIK